MGILSDEGSSPPAREGDLIIVQEKYDSLTSVQLRAGAHLNNRYGRFAHNDLIGKPLGRRWDAVSHPGPGSGTQQCAGFVHAFAPTPELWSMAMFHRTQIVYPHDAAVIALFLDLRPGCVVVEAGTGSGSASVAFARAVAPTGSVFSFEFHVPRAAAAEADFEALGLASRIKVSQGVNVVKDGFVGVPDGVADAVFLDLPAPYLMGEEIARVLKPNGTVCTFSPCIEQVQRSSEMFRAGPFHSLRTVTAPVRTYETREQVLDASGFGEGTTELNGSNPKDENTNAESHSKNRMPSVEDKGNRIRKTSRTAGAERIAVANANDSQHEGRVLRASIRVHSKPFSSMKGHTSYLTFARRTRTGAQRAKRTRSGEDSPYKKRQKLDTNSTCSLL